MEVLDLITHSPALAGALALLLGLCIGSFLNVVILRLPAMMEREWSRDAAEIRGEPVPESSPFNLLTPRSHCPACGHRLRLTENIPVFSWLLLRGRCSACRARISPRYPLVELLGGLLAWLAFWRFGPSAAGAGALLLSAGLLALTFIDIDTQLLPDDITLPLLWLGLVFNLGGVFAPIDAAVIGACAGYLSLWSIYWLFRLATGKEGMGRGDFKLLAVLGAWLGWQALPMIILLASAVGAIAGIAMMLLRGHGRATPMAFGPYLCGAGLLAMHLGPALASRLGW